MEPVEPLIICEMCRAEGARCWGPPGSAPIRVVQTLGMRVDRWLCDACLTCAVCGELVEHGEGTAADHLIRAIHRKCFSSNAPAARSIVHRMRSALAGLGYGPPGVEGYPPGWPRCVFCLRPALDGHLTCGDAECSEAAARAREAQL